ncbi:MAG TPA: integrase core domain-containing protein [Candidatus Fournierella excrementigallinarum]|nr:integrase core domain-containing protein [Candidatus Fournierella excrementigallinarum]
MADSGVHVSKKRILAIMQEMGLSSVRVDLKKQFKRKQQYEKQNLLKREFSAGHPNQIWVSDIAYFSTFKREEAYRKDYTSEQHFRRSTEEYIRFYNEVRPHQTLNYKTSQAFEDAYKPALSESTV